MKGKRSSMADVARLAGVSTATVSHVLNGTRFVSAQMADRVRTAMQQLDYRPNQSARTLRTGRTNTVFFVVPDISNGYFSTAIEAVETVLADAGYRLLIANTKENFEQELIHLQQINNGLADGILLASTAQNWEVLRVALPATLPIVLVDRDFTQNRISSVSVDTTAALYEAVCALTKAGHRRIGYIAGIPRLSSSKERLQAYCRAMKDCCLPIEEGFVQTGDSMRKSSPACCARLLDLGCSAIVISNGVMTSDVLYYCSNGHLRLGIDVEIVGFVDSPIQNYSEQYFATIRLPSEDLGRRAGEMILQQIAHPEMQPHSKRLLAELVLNAKHVADP